jgi:Ca-activated chloride channel family protein
MARDHISDPARTLGMALAASRRQRRFQVTSIGSTRFLGSLAAGAAVGLGLLAGQTSAADRDLTFSGGVEMVNLTVTVTNGRNELVSGLTPDDFEIMEDGVPQRLAVFSRDRVPVSLVVLLDVSSSMEGKLGVAQDAALRLVHSLAEGDEVQVVQFNQRPEVVRSFSRDLQAVAASLKGGRPTGPTALYTALYVALKDLARRHDPAQLRRQAIVVLSDGDDTASLVSDSQVLDLAKRSNISIYGVNLRPKVTAALDLSSRRGAFFLPELSRATGGLTHFAASVAQLGGAYDRIADELRTQYSLGYVPTNVARNGEWRRIAIRTPLVDSLQLRYKPGYFAAR